MMFETATYAAPSIDFSIEPETAYPTGLASFLLRLAAYFQGCLASLPSPKNICANRIQDSLAVIDSALDASSEPLIKVRMNRHLSRRLRWLIRRGRVERSGKMRLATAADQARCNLTPGQFMEYSIRVHRISRIRIYGLGLGRRALLLRGFTLAALQGCVLSLRKAALCSAPLCPD